MKFATTTTTTEKKNVINTKIDKQTCLCEQKLEVAILHESELDRFFFKGFWDLRNGVFVVLGDGKI